MVIPTSCGNSTTNHLVPERNPRPRLVRGPEIPHLAQSGSWGHGYGHYVGRRRSAPREPYRLVSGVLWCRVVLRHKGLPSREPEGDRLVASAGRGWQSTVMTNGGRGSEPGWTS